MRKDFGQLDFRKNQRQNFDRLDSSTPQVTPRPVPPVPATDTDSATSASSPSISRTRVEAGPDDRHWDTFVRIVKVCLSRNGSDVHMRAGNHPCIRIDGEIVPVKDFPVMAPENVEDIARAILRPAEFERLRNNLQVDSAVGNSEIGRVRINAFMQRGSVALALRMIRTDIPAIEELGLPAFAKNMARLRSGLVLVAGATGSGKSTTLAAIIDMINKNQRRHIITIEDPIEFLFRDVRAIIAQREIGIDAHSFPEAMSAALREDPDIILLSDLRDTETIEFALNAAETGHLVFGTVHAPTTYDTITRIVANFIPEAQPTIRAKLSQNLRSVIGQRLVPKASGEGRLLVCEVLTVSSRVRELILDPIKIKEIGDLLKSSKSVEGMISFDEQLHAFHTAGQITTETALRNATSATDLKLRLQGFRE